MKTNVQNTKFQIPNTSKGITLVALVITIIVLLILAGVAINMAINSDGLFGKAKEAAEKWNISVKEEQDAIENMLLQANEINGGATKQGSIELNKTSLTLEIVDGVNVEETLVATLKNIEGEVNWTSSDLAVATVDANGKVTTVGAGESIITASYSRYSASCKVTVVAKTTPKVTLNANTGEVEEEKTLVLTASLNVTAEENIVWTSSNNSIATVSGSGTNNSTGTITGVKAGGPVTITATYQGKTATCTVTVKEKVNLISFTVQGETYYAPEGYTWGQWVADAEYNTVGAMIWEGRIWWPVADSSVLGPDCVGKYNHPEGGCLLNQGGLVSTGSPVGEYGEWYALICDDF